MNKTEIKKFLTYFSDKLSRTIVVVDFSNVEKWKESLGWKVGIQELATFARNFSKGNRELRRFYYGSDYGKDSGSATLNLWSNNLIERARMNRFEIITKRVKYIHDNRNSSGFTKKCDLDVEMTVDLIRLKDKYDCIILFSGDGDLVFALDYLKKNFSKTSYIFGARNHVAGEIVDAVKEGIVEKLCFIEDFEYRLNMDRFRYKQ